MKVAAVLPYAFGLALVVALLAGVTQVPSTNAEEAEKAAPAHASLQLSWVPDWLMTPLSRAIADATDPHDRKAN